MPISYAQSTFVTPTMDTSTKITVDKCKKLVDSLNNANLKHLKTLEGLLQQKQDHRDQLIQDIRTSIKALNLQLAQINLELTQTQIALHTTKKTLKRERKKHFWKSMGMGVGGVLVGILVKSVSH